MQGFHSLPGHAKQMFSDVSDLKLYNMFNTAISCIVYGMIFSLEGWHVKLEGGSLLIFLLLLALRATNASISVILVLRIRPLLSCR